MLFPKRLTLGAVILSIHSIFVNIPRINGMNNRKGKYLRISYRVEYIIVLAAIDKTEYIIIPTATKPKAITVNKKKLYKKSQEKEIGYGLDIIRNSGSLDLVFMEINIIFIYTAKSNIRKEKTTISHIENVIIVIILVLAINFKY